MTSRLIITAVTAAAAMTAYAQQPSLRIYSGAPDTVRAEKTVLVAVTDPGCTATVNSKPVHVYKTGSFGTQLDLTPGLNTVDIAVSNTSGTTTRQLNIFCAPAQQNTNPDREQSLRQDATLAYDAPFFVLTKPGAYLQYGNGDDRLGGSKMGFIDADIPLKVIGVKGSLYCVRLASGRIAYIPKYYTEKTDRTTHVVNTGSWSVANMGKSDRVTVSLPVRLAYQYSTNLDPSTITIDIFGATDNSNWITQRSLELGAIAYVDFQQVSDDVYRVIIHLKDKYNWGFRVYYPDNSNNLTVDVRHTPQSLSLKNLTIGLDAGHGGPYPGARSPSGILEKDVNLDIVLRMDRLLRKRGAKTVLSRDGDTGPSMADRKKIFADANVDLAISVHNNSGGSALSSPGTSVLYKHLFDRPLSECVLRRMVGTGLPLFGLVGNFNFSLNAPTLYPNTLVEGMFMSSLAEEEKLADPEFRQKVAEQLVAGIEDYLQLVAKSRK